MTHGRATPELVKEGKWTQETVEGTAEGAGAVESEVQLEVELEAASVAEEVEGSVEETGEGGEGLTFFESRSPSVRTTNRRISLHSLGKGTCARKGSEASQFTNHRPLLNLPLPLRLPIHPLELLLLSAFERLRHPQVRLAVRVRNDAVVEGDDFGVGEGAV